MVVRQSSTVLTVVACISVSLASSLAMAMFPLTITNYFSWSHVMAKATTGLQRPFSLERIYGSVWYFKEMGFKWGYLKALYFQRTIGEYKNCTSSML